MLHPVRSGDLPELAALKADPQVFAVMLGGVRTTARAAAELAEDIQAWGAHGYGTWAVRPRGGGRLLGMVALQARADGRGVGLRFAFWHDLQGLGYGREAAGAALNYGHSRAGLARIVAVARDDNFASRTVLGAIGMRECERFTREGRDMVTFESIRS